MACTNHPDVIIGLRRCRRCGRPFCRDCVVSLRGFHYCAECKGDQVRDIQSGTEAGALELASVGRRFAALWLDSMLFTFLLVVPAFLLFLGSAAFVNPGSSDAAAEGVVLLLTVGFAVIVIVYEALMLGQRGQTLGKIAVGIKVVTPEGQAIGVGQAWGRAVLRQVFFSYLALVNYLPAIFTKNKTCIHDLACKTRVVRVRR